MEQTLGKRIMMNRKRLGLTQDALAEQLGVTAQAVSKWENDQSCPDITMLPKLAEIFGISTDELLGHRCQPVHQAEVVAEEENDGLHIQKGNWEFKWDSGRRSALGMAVFVLMVGGLLLASNLLNWGASFWEILWPTALLVYGFFGLFSGFSFFRAGCFLLGGYFLASNLSLLPFSVGADVIFPVIILLFGLSLLADALRKPKKPHFHITRNGGDSKEKLHYSASSETFDCSMSFGDNTRMIDLPRLSRGEVSCSFGELRIDLSGCGAFAPGCEIDASCSFGELIFLVPKCCRVEHDISTAFGNLSVTGQPDPCPTGILHLCGSVNFGEIEIRYI